MAKMASSTHFVAAVAALLIPQFLYANGEGFLKHDSKGFAGRQHEFDEAISAVMGCASSGEGFVTNLSKVEEALAPMWGVLPKSDEGRVDWKILRYLTHRYFMQQSGLLIRGLEPGRQVNNSDAGVAVIFNKESFSFVESALVGKRNIGGFTIKDAASWVATLERMIYDSESEILVKSIKKRLGWGRERNPLFNRDELSRVFETYMVHWLSGGDDFVAEAVLKNRTLLAEVFPYFESITQFVEGVIRSLEYSRRRSLKSGHGNRLMTQQFSFADAHSVAGDITKSFASYWESECQTIKSSLVALDRTGTGRITLSDFYGANADGDWRFGESEQYLRQLGALDETSSPYGSQVIITNYLYGASNCIIATKNYFVCCLNACEAFLNDIEVAIGEPVGLPEDILRSLSNITNFEDNVFSIAPGMSAQLQRIADTHGGKVPLHGRLFAQWLHFLLPHECPFPHKTGTYHAQAPSEDDGSYLASQDDIQYHAHKRDSNLTLAMAEMEEAQMMSQWSEEEELIVDYSLHIHGPWAHTRVGAKMSFLLLLAVAAMVAFRQGKKSAASSATNLLEACPKAHFV